MPPGTAPAGIVTWSSCPVGVGTATTEPGRAPAGTVTANIPVGVGTEPAGAPACAGALAGAADDEVQPMCERARPAGDSANAACAARRSGSGSEFGDRRLELSLLRPNLL